MYQCKLHNSTAHASKSCKSTCEPCKEFLALFLLLCMLLSCIGRTGRTAAPLHWQNCQHCTSSVCAKARSVSDKHNACPEKEHSQRLLLVRCQHGLICCCQVVTVNDYLARRDSEWVGQVHKFLGMQVGLIQQGLSVRHSSCKAGIDFGCLVSVFL